MGTEDDSCSTASRSPHRGVTKLGLVTCTQSRRPRLALFSAQTATSIPPEPQRFAPVFAHFNQGSMKPRSTVKAMFWDRMIRLRVFET